LKSISEYNDLYNVIGSIYGSGGTGTFVLPDLRGKFIRGYDNGRGIDTGRTFGSSQESQNKSHNHSTSGSLSSAGDHYHS
jgi:microcystin-dependent protein